MIRLTQDFASQWCASQIVCHLVSMGPGPWTLLVGPPLSDTSVMDRCMIASVRESLDTLCDRRLNNLSEWSKNDAEMYKALCAVESQILMDADI